MTGSTGSVCVDAHVGGWEIIDAPPAHLQADESDEQDNAGSAPVLRPGFPEMDAQQVAEPRDGSPGLLRIPSPVCSPSLLGPEGSEQHSESQEGRSYIHEVVGDIQVLGAGPVTFEAHHIDGHQGRGAEDGV